MYVRTSSDVRARLSITHSTSRCRQCCGSRRHTQHVARSGCLQRQIQSARQWLQCDHAGVQPTRWRQGARSFRRSLHRCTTVQDCLVLVVSRMTRLERCGPRESEGSNAWTAQTSLRCFVYRRDSRQHWQDRLYIWRETSWSACTTRRYRYHQTYW